MADAANCLLSYEVTEGKCWYLYVSCDSTDLRDFESIDATTELLSTIDHGNYLAHTLVKVKGGVEYHFYLYQDVDGDESQEDRVFSVTALSNPINMKGTKKKKNCHDASNRYSDGINDDSRWPRRSVSRSQSARN
jgi:hypothetical protein